MRTQFRRSPTAGLLTTLIGVPLLLAASSAFARSSYLTEFEFVYPASRSDNNARCALCHNDYDEGIGYNPYGTAFRNASGSTLEARYRAIEGLNSDGDPGGYTNRQEIDLSTQPGWKVGDTVPVGVTGDLDPVGDNSPPDVTNPGDQLDNENTLVNLQIVADDADGDDLTYSAIGLPPGLGINPTTGVISGTIPFTAVQHPSLEMGYTVEVTVDDGIDPVTVLFSWTVVDVNRAPIANDDAAASDGAPAVIDVLANDSDADGDALTVTNVTNPGDGTAGINGDDTVTYTPDCTPGATFVDAFDYTIADGFGGSASATVTVNVTCPEAPNDPPQVTTPVDQLSTETDAVSLQIDATDPEGDPLTYTASGLPADLTIDPSTGAITGTVSYDAVAHPDLQQVYPITVQVTDGVNLPIAVTFDWTVEDLNRDPVAVDDSDTTVHDTPVSIAVLDNDSDADGDSLSVAGVGNAQNGTVGTDGTTVTYTPDALFVGTDSFDYDVDDGFGGSATATVTVTVTNEAPVANDNVYFTDQGVALSVPAPGVLANDTDADGDALQAVLDTGVSNGALTLNPDGSFSYAPDGGFIGQDSFTYVANDGIEDSVAATVTINVQEVTVNDPPVVDNPGDQASGETDLVSVQIDASDPDGDALAYSATGLPPSLAIDAVTGQILGVVSFDAVAHPDTEAVYTVTVTVDDGEFTASATFDWTITDVNRNPVAADDSATTDLDTPVTVDVLANDSDDDGDALSVSGVFAPLNGTAVDNGDGTVTYTPNTGFTGEDNFVYTIEDGFGGSAEATVTVMVVDPGAGEDADVFLTRINAPRQLVLQVDKEAERTIRVFGDGDTIEQEVTVKLKASDPDGLEVEVEPSEVDATVVPGGNPTRFDFEAEIECEKQGTYEIVWTAIIDADQNADPANDRVQAVTTVECKKSRGRR